MQGVVVDKDHRATPLVADATTTTIKGTNVEGPALLMIGGMLIIRTHTGDVGSALTPNRVSACS